MEAVFTANHLTITDKQTIRKKLSINHQNTHINTIRIKENKQLNIQQKQNYPDSVAFYDPQPGNEVGLFYNGPEHHWGLCKIFFHAMCVTMLQDDYSQVESMASSKQKELESLSEELTELRSSATSRELQVCAFQLNLLLFFL